MINNGTDIGFIHDIAGLDQLRKQAVNGDENSEKEALTAAAKQFEAIFTSMLFKSMRDANSSFESGLMDSQNQQFYRQMMDEQMASELSSSGSLGLADMIVAQLTSGSVEDPSAANRSTDFESLMEKVDQTRRARAEQPEVDVAQQAEVATQTLEYHQGVPVKERAAFRSYANFEESFNDYVRFLHDNPRYTLALRHGGSSEQFIQGIHKAGYATDPQYADKVLKVKAKIDQM